MQSEIKKFRVYRLVKHMRTLVVLHGDAHEGSTLIDMFEMHALAEGFQNDITYRKYLKVGKEENAKGKFFDFTEEEIIVQEGIAFINETQEIKQVN